MRCAQFVLRIVLPALLALPHSTLFAATRNLDVELSYLSGVPDLLGICVEEHWTQPWSMEVCAGTFILASSLSTHAKRTVTTSGSNWTTGWGWGLRAFNHFGCFDSCGDGSVYAIAPEALLSAEWNPGFNERGWGFTLEFDLGVGAGIEVGNASETTEGDRNTFYPWGRVSFGLAF